MRLSSDRVKALEAIPLFAGYPRRRLARIASLVEEVSVGAGTVVCGEGLLGRDVFVVVEGRADISLRGESVGTAQAGDVFGDMSFIDRGPRAATVTASTPMKLLMFDARRFSTLLDLAPALGPRLIRAMCARLRAAGGVTCSS